MSLSRGCVSTRRKRERACLAGVWQCIASLYPNGIPAASLFRGYCFHLRCEDYYLFQGALRPYNWP
ncbi:hypothetical protein FRX31_028872 [Thalictrum thalictroides]|uniref:Uncharacterized protein n=1 Tax=Thalictrum thalictroides TaxID=46969 RepID=A0A7J6V8Z8_THATH|nr:hypothetical protein FRX31_028872 [Thalictrum thalictroides]